MQQISLKIPKDRKETRITIKLDNHDMDALKRGMGIVGETNISGYLRRLIHEGKHRRT